MRRKHIAPLAAALGFTAFLFPGTAVAAYPERPIRYIVPSAAGGAPDIIARTFATELGRQMGQQFVVDNRPGASGTIAMEMLARAAPDGYTIAHGTLTQLAINRSVLPKLPYHPDKDLQPVLQTTATPNLLAVTLSLPAKSVQELIDYARKNPGKLQFASGGNATTGHMSAELFKHMTGTDMLHVPYESGGATNVFTDLAAGRVHLIFGPMPSIAPHVRAGRVRGLGVTSAKRVAAFPELPTVAEAGVPGFEVTVWGGIIVPAGVTNAMVARLNAEFNKVLMLPHVREKLNALGAEVVGGTPDQFSEHIRKETAKWADVVKRAGVKVD